MENQNDIPQQEAQTSVEPAVATAVSEAPGNSSKPESSETSPESETQSIPEEMELEAATAPEPEPEPEPESSDAPDEERPLPQSTINEPMADAMEPRISDSPSAKVLTEDESIQRAKFPPLDNTITTQALGKIEYLKDVDLDASVELGNTVLTVEKILNLNVGSIIELNQTIGDQVRLLINGNPYACGEVVVIGDKFGVRITKLLH